MLAKFGIEESTKEQINSDEICHVSVDHGSTYRVPNLAHV